MHVHGFKEEGTITTYFDMTVLNHLDRFHLAMDVINHLPNPGTAGVRLKKLLQDKLVEHRQYINIHGQDLPEVRNWKWTNSG
jgi:xylulose-5-phosphate/fructose-6-phosphate phosphoketolase